MKINLRISMAFRRLPDNSLVAFALKVHTDLYSQSVYANAPVTAADLQAGITAFSTAKTAQANGGKLATVEKNQRREELLEMLNKLADFAQLACDGDLAVLLESGFEATRRAHVPTSLPKATVERIVNGHSGEALVTVKRERGARIFEVQAAETDESGVPGPYGPAVAVTFSRKIPVAGLTPGKMCVFRARCIGGKGDTSDWSDGAFQRVM